MGQLPKVEMTMSVIYEGRHGATPGLATAGVITREAECTPGRGHLGHLLPSHLSLGESRDQESAPLFMALGSGTDRVRVGRDG